MSKRSRVLLITIIIIIVFVFVSVLSGNQDENSDKELSDFEQEITNPNNELDPLNENNAKNVLILDIANKIEGFIDKVFNFVIVFFESIVDKVFVVVY